MSVDSERSLICDISRLGNHLIKQQNTEQQNYSQHDVTELAVFLTKQQKMSRQLNDLILSTRDIEVLLNNYTVNNVTLQAVVSYINTVELVMHHQYTLRKILQCLSSENRVRSLHTEA